STSSSKSVTMAKNMVLAISIVIVILITLLMERSFISKETNEIALMKAIGFRNSDIVSQHVSRFFAVICVSSLMALILDYPFTKLICDRIFAVMGAVSGIVYKINFVEVFLIYPAIVCAVVVSGAWLMALYIRTIKADEISNIE
ncbi:MAG: FtsX-like permease family protein, partial [Lachnospiraceae bacterium]|nr:FtsX-like permease family protein [Lachnospiraceae bacterium]